MISFPFGLSTLRSLTENQKIVTVRRKRTAGIAAPMKGNEKDGFDLPKATYDVSSETSLTEPGGLDSDRLAPSLAAIDDQTVGEIVGG